MGDIVICRICLRSDTKLYNIEKFKLKMFYEKFNGHPIGNRDALPRYFCFECAALLHKFYKFREKSDFSQRALRDILLNGFSITYKAVNDFLSKNRRMFKYNSLQLLVRNENVKTFNVKTEAIYDDKDQYSDEYYSDDDDDDDFKCEDLKTNQYAEKSDPQIEVVEDIEIEDAFETKVNYPTFFESLNKQPENETTNCNFEIKKKRRTIIPSEISDSEIEETFDKEGIEPEYIEQPKKETASTKKFNLKPKKSEKKEGFITIAKPKKKTQIHPPDTKKPKFKAKKSTLERRLFLNSGYWKKTNLNDEIALTEFQARALDKKYLKAAFKCTDCFRGFSKKNMLDRHIPLRHSEAAGSLQCRFCKMRFKLPHALKTHMLQHFIKYECLRCNLVCNLESSALFHEEYHNGVIRKCTHCDKEFRHMSTFYTHLRTHRSEHMCTLCGESFVSPVGLRLHKKAKHSLETENQKVGVGSTFCELCKIKFETKEAFDKHLVHSAMHTDKAELLDNNITIDLSREDADEKDDQKSKPLITRKSRVENTLSAVRKILPKKTNSKKPTTCRQCGKHFDTQSACMKHHSSEHPGTSFFSPQDRVICEICGASLVPGSMNAHLNQHTRLRVFTCDTCGRSFTTRHLLRKHIVSHTGERNHVCNICGKRYAQITSRDLHHKTVHLKQPYPKRNRKRVVEPNTAGTTPFGVKEEENEWRH